MRRRRSGGRPRFQLWRTALLLSAAAFVLLWGQYGSPRAAAEAIRARIFPTEADCSVPESAPPLPERPSAGHAKSPAERATAPAPAEETEIPWEPALRNDTAYAPDLAALPPDPIRLTPGSEPQVLIVHTHTSEAYTPDEAYAYVPDDNDRTLDPAFNVTAVGDQVETRLTAAGISVLHDRTLNDYPSYNGSYSRMLRIVEGYLAEYPTISVVLDIHRDAVIYPDGSRFAPRAEIGGRDAAQVMLVVGTDEGGLSHAHWRENLAFALQLQRSADTLYPGLMRPVNLRSSRFNQHVSPGALIVEVGSSGNTLGEALYGAGLFTDALLQTVLGP